MSLLLGKIELDAGVDIESRYDGSLTITRPEHMSTAKLLGKFDRAGFKVLSIDWESEQFRVIRESQYHPRND